MIPGTDDRARGLNAMNEVQVTGWLWVCIAHADCNCMSVAPSHEGSAFSGFQPPC